MINFSGAFPGYQSVANGTVDVISRLANGRLCVPSLLPAGIFNPRKALFGDKLNVVNQAFGQFGNLRGLVTRNIVDDIQKVSGKITGALKILGALTSISQNTNIDIDNIKKGLFATAMEVMDYNFSKKNCQANAADTSRCIKARVSKEFDRKLQRELYNRAPLEQIVDVIMQRIQSGSNIFEPPVDNYQNQIKKAALQLSRINRWDLNPTYSIENRITAA